MSEPTGLDVAGNMAHEFIRFGERIGEARERERILALLEDDDAMHQLWWVAYRHLEPHPTSGRMSQYQLMDVVIDIIKGGTHE